MTMFNTSLSGGCFQQQLRNAIDKSVIKKDVMDESFASDNRSVCNRPFLSKVFEGIIHNQPTSHLHTYSSPRRQVYYRKGFCTEEAVFIGLYSDIIGVTSNENCLPQSFVDFKAAFNTMVHNMPL